VGVGETGAAWIVSTGREAVASIPDGEGVPPPENSQAVRARQNKNSRSLFGDIGGYFTTFFVKLLSGWSSCTVLLAPHDTSDSLTAPSPAQSGAKTPPRTAAGALF